jgi:hypothetical protein
VSAVREESRGCPAIDLGGCRLFVRLGHRLAWILRWLTDGEEMLVNYHKSHPLK